MVVLRVPGLECCAGVPEFGCQGAATHPAVGVPRQCHTCQVGVPRRCFVSRDRGAVLVLLCQDWGQSAGVMPRVLGPGLGCHSSASRARVRVPRQRHACHGSASCPGLTVPRPCCCAGAGAGVPRHCLVCQVRGAALSRSAVAVPPIPGPRRPSGPTWCHRPGRSGSGRSGSSAWCPAARGRTCPPCGSPAPRRAAAPPPAPWRC